MKEEGGTFLVNDELLVNVKGGGKPAVSNGELRVPVTFNKGAAQLEVTYGWAE